MMATMTTAAEPIAISAIRPLAPTRAAVIYDRAVPAAPILSIGQHSSDSLFTVRLGESASQREIVGSN